MYLTYLGTYLHTYLTIYLGRYHPTTPTHCPLQHYIISSSLVLRTDAMSAMASSPLIGRCQPLYKAYQAHLQENEAGVGEEDEGQGKEAKAC